MQRSSGTIVGVLGLTVVGVVVVAAIFQLNSNNSSTGVTAEAGSTTRSVVGDLFDKAN